MRFTFKKAITTLTAAAAIATQVPTSSTTCEPIQQPACEGTEFILSGYRADFQQEFNCDLNPPQVLSFYMDDPGPIQQTECDNSGGALATAEDREICRGIDY